LHAPITITAIATDTTSKHVAEVRAAPIWKRFTIGHCYFFEVNPQLSAPGAIGLAICVAARNGLKLECRQTLVPFQDTRHD
jgi:hypothetical protein